MANGKVRLISSIGSAQVKEVEAAPGTILAAFLRDQGIDPSSKVMILVDHQQVTDMNTPIGQCSTVSVVPQSQKGANLS